MKFNDDVNTASPLLNEKWQRYQITIKNNTLYHREMLLALSHFLSGTIGTRTFFL